MTTAQAHIYNAATGETIKRDLTAEELEQAAADKVAGEAAKKAAEAKKAAKQAVLDKLGLTADEAAALLG
jgi:hypothetical protein